MKDGLHTPPVHSLHMTYVQEHTLYFEIVVYSKKKIIIMT